MFALWKLECIPVGCVPSAAVAVSPRGSAPWGGGGVCSLGWGVSAPGGQDVCSRGGVSAPGGLLRGVSAPGGGVSAPWGGVLLWGGMASQHALKQTPAPRVDRHTPVKT